MTTRFDAIDLGALSSPDIIETISFETLLADRKAKAQQLFAEADILQDWDPSLESDPIVKLLEESAFRETILRQRINDAARACMIATAKGADLDNIAARYHVTRKTIEAGDPSAVPPVDPVMESNTSLRGRILLAFEALSVAGPVGAYRYHALSADPLVYDVDVASPTPGSVVISVMTSTESGVPDQAVLDNVIATLTNDDVRPLTDQVTVQAATAVEYAFSAVLTVYGGPDAEIVRTAALEGLTAFVAQQKRLGEPITLDGLHKAARVDGVQKVVIFQGDGETAFAEIAPADNQFPLCTGFSVQVGGQS
ncbi:MAG: baseplate J/gp47 family protein [Thalassospira sp.]|uniref:baseplate assembly protein n=1 Tax=Thalassospira sp. 11-3 TaxID=2135614 RepID=UPI000D752A89|nr:baseplate J/gp47 family protein [Thalassospira sp. 11-3]MBL4839927.1 baseplate J/gp47 family protein [Thalassospira sp.]PXX30870.1 phage-related baseplate assembly protein [Thalassospira sp. 11-3]